MANKSKVNQTTPAPKSVDDVIQFFLRWKTHHDNKTIDSAGLEELLRSEFSSFQRILTEICDEEPMGRDEADSDNLDGVVDFLDELSK